MQQQVWRDLFNRRLCKLKSNAINYLNPAHKSGDAWVRIASSVQSRGGRPLILECASCQDCTLEAMRTQVFANQCIDCTVVLFAHASVMCYEAIICPRCSSASIVKNGKTSQRKQRYLCKDCRRQFIRDYANLGCVGAVRDLVVPLTINGAGIRDIERVLFLSTNTILKTLLEAATLADDPAYPRRVHDLEMDESWSFIGAKRRQRWTWYGYDRQRRKVVAFVNERRTDAACRQLLQKLGDCRITRYHTDNWQSYARFLPTRRHRTGKEGTSRIERHNLNFRTRLKRLQRHTICYSKSAVTHDAVIKLYVHHSNAGHHHF